MNPQLRPATLLFLLAGLGAQNPPPSHPPCAGDRCVDPRDAAEWSTDGQVLACAVEVGDVAATPCPKSTPDAVATGLAVAAAIRQLWILDSRGVITMCQLTMPPTPLAAVATGLVGTATCAPTALALDERHRLVFYTCVDFERGQTELFVAPMAQPGQWLDRRVLPAACSSITGLSTDGAHQTLQLTNGERTFAMRYCVAENSRLIQWIGPPSELMP
jgi:hypothetical protein